MPNNDDKVFDVAKPGQSAPDASARPVIISHRPMVQDPMMSKDKSSNDPVVPTKEAKEEISAVHTAASVEPSTELKAQAAITAKEETDNQAAEAKESKKNAEVPAGSDSAAVETVAGEAQSKKDSEKLNKEEEAGREALEKLIESKQYNLPIKQTKASRSAKKILIILLVCVVLGIIGLDLAVDAGLIDIGINPPIDLIKN